MNARNYKVTGSTVLTFSTLVFFACFGIPANAANIWSESFESPDISEPPISDADGYSSSEPTGWDMSNGGISDNRPGDINTPFGDQVGWTNGGGMETTTNALSEVLQEGTYTLTFNVSVRSAPADYTVNLKAVTASSTNVLGTVSDSGLTNTDMSSYSNSLSFTTDGSHAALLGQTISVQFTCTDFQPQFDNFQLDFEPAPPSGTVFYIR